MGFFVRLYYGFFRAIERALDGWFLGLLARFVFAGVLFVFFWNSALTKVGSGFAGFFTPAVGAYAQILPKQMEAVGFDPSQLSDFEHVVVYAGTYAEFVLPILIVAGLFTRLASLGMIVFIAMMTYTDITGHNVDAATIGALFDRDPSSLISDQRTLWLFPLVYLVLRGPGAISLDWLFGRRFVRDQYDYYD